MSEIIVETHLVTLGPDDPQSRIAVLHTLTVDGCHITEDMYQQLDVVSLSEIEPVGRVNSQSGPGVVGRVNGVLVRACPHTRDDSLPLIILGLDS
jgi:hypothetical protein